ncbi:MAG: alanine:cation symporter family protein [Prevotella sp.]|nr:alanine:cation symporter family protein [Prevotella sp.]
MRFKGFNIIHIVHIFKSTLFGGKSASGKSSKGKISQFRALSTALAASMGTGNIIGVAAAVSLGGAGAVFWMWVCALFGTATGLAENILGTKYRRHSGGPMAYIAHGAGMPRLAAVYAAACAAASFGIGNMTQTNALSAAMSEFGVPPLISGLAAALVCGAVIFGGGKKVAAAAEKMIPAVSLFYIAGAVFVMVLFGENILDMLKNIFASAVGYSQIAGGICGAALKKAVTVGLRRGVFSNEAGMGSSVLVHTETGCSEPLQMGMWAVAETVIDTLICCTATAFVILLTGADASGAEGLAMVTEGFSRGLGSFAVFFVSASTAVFAVCTLLGWYFYGEKCVLYVFGTGNSKAVLLYRILYTAAAFLGAAAELSLVWGAADILNWFMLVINLLSVLLLSGEAAECVNDYTKSIFKKKK